MSLLLVVATLSPLTQVPSQYWLDWLHALSAVWWGKARFGVEVQFSYGPWGFVWGGYHPKTFVLTCIFWLVYAILAWSSAWRISVIAAGPRRPVLAAGMLLIWGALLGGDHSCFSDARFFVLPIFLLLNHFLLERRPHDWLTLALCTMIGFTGTVKLTYLVAGGIAVLSVAFDELRLRPRSFYAAPFAAIAFLIAWIVGGQSLLDLPAYVSTALEVVRGYPEAMNLTARFDAWQIGLYSASFLGLTAVMAIYRDRCGRWLPAAAIGAVALVVFRASFVRWDEHSVIASGFAVAVIPLVATSLWRELSAALRGVVATCLLAALANQVITTQRWDPSGTPYSPLHALVMIGRFLHECGLVVGQRPSTAAAGHRTFMARTASALPLLPVSGSVDIVPHELSAVFAAGLDYSPRPTLQSYAAYTPRLSRANAAFYAGDRRPDNVFFRTFSIDGRLPSLEDPKLWLELMRTYRLAGQTGAFLHLVPADHPRELSIKPLASFSARFGERFDLPTLPKDKLIWGRIRLDSHVLARVASQFYKPPRVHMELTIGAGQPVTVRMITENAAEGFLLSPIILNDDAFTAVFDRMEIPGDLDGWRPRSIQIVGDPEGWARTYFRTTIHVELSELSLRTVSESTRPSIGPALGQGIDGTGIALE